MNRAPILFRCDGTATTGWESFYQCLVLAGAMQRRRRGTYFFSRLEPQTLAGPILRGGHEWAETTTAVGSADDLDATIREARRLGAAAVVVAAPNVSEEYLRELDASGPLVMTVDNAAAVRFPNKLVLNPFLGLPRDRYRLERGTQLLRGLRYPLVRPQIRRLRPLRAQEPPQPFRALVALGEDDFDNLTQRIAEMLVTNDAIHRLDLFARPHHPHLNELREFAANYDGRVGVATEVPELAARASRCHFAVTAGDGLSLELACVGVPQLMVTLAERHAANARRLDEEGVATDLGPAAALTPDALAAAVEVLLTDPMERQGMARCGRQLIDGRGPDRLVCALEVLLHPAQPAPLRIAA
ncbi:MAG TPA: polysaccharide biosynthesis protein [Gemmataceae bacterium]|jgi:spore coat polysaccharide biosynthesis predicted glycosyltransferase SpsG